MLESGVNRADRWRRLHHWLEMTSTTLVNSSGEVVPGEVGNIYILPEIFYLSMCDVTCFVREARTAKSVSSPTKVQYTAAVLFFYWDKFFSQITIRQFFYQLTHCKHPILHEKPNRDPWH